MYDAEERLRSALHDAAPDGWSVQFEPVARRARVRRNVRAVTAAGASALAVVVVTVTATSLVPAGTPSAPPAAGRTTEGKPTPGQTSGNCVRGHDPALVQIDWVDFVRLNGREYRAIPDHVRPDQVGAAVGKVGCMFSDTLPGPDHIPQDGDAAFLAVGTLVHALKGYPPSDRVVAQKPDGQWTVYQVSQR
jgi:hypothetical protein